MHATYKRLISSTVTAALLSFSIAGTVAYANPSPLELTAPSQTDVFQGSLKDLTQTLTAASGVEIFVSEALLNRSITLSLNGNTWSEKLEHAFSGMNTIAVHTPEGDLYRLFVLNVGDSPADVYTPGSNDSPLWSLQEVSDTEANAVNPYARPDSIQSINFGDFSAARPDDRYRMKLPGGDATMVVSRAYALDGDMLSISGYLEEYGEWHTVHVVQWSDGYFGTVNTPEGEYHIESANKRTYLVDMARSGLNSAPIDPGAVLPIEEYMGADKDSSAVNNPSAEEVLMDGSVGRYIDVMAFYTPGVQNKEARVRYLVDLGNTVLANSGANFRFRLVYVNEVDYPEDASNLKTLGDFLNNLDVFADLEALRDEYGADLVTIVRPYNRDTHDSCGRAYILGRNNSWMNPRSAYSVASDGSSNGYYCDRRTLTHELGHNMGLAHDHNQTATGRHEYSHGHHVPGVFGTIMAYANKRVDYFSTPLKTCQGHPCGVPEGEELPADAVRTLNETSSMVASFRAAKTEDTYAPKPVTQGSDGGGGGGGSLDFLWLGLVGLLLTSKFRFAGSR